MLVGGSKLRRETLAIYVTRIEEMRMYTKFWSENLKKRFNSDDTTRRSEDNIYMDLKGRIWEAVHWVNQDRGQWRALISVIIGFRIT
jgi:hypothetical protein